MSLTKTVKAAALSLGIGAGLAATQAGHAQTISIQFVGGGSSALQGDYRFNASFLALSPDETQAQIAASGYDGVSAFGPANKPSFNGTGTQNNQFGEGALPQAIETIGQIGTYKPAIQAERVIVDPQFQSAGRWHGHHPDQLPDLSLHLSDLRNFQRGWNVQALRADGGAGRAAQHHSRQPR